MVKASRVYFISGTSGVGKTTTMSYLKALLPLDKFDIRDFDERGVPDGGGPKWHRKETSHWLDVAEVNAKNGISTIICGFNEPKRVRAVLKESHPPVELILLHASGDIIKRRLLGRHSTPESTEEIQRASGVSLEEFIKNCTTHAPQLRTLFEKEECLIIDTDTKSPAEVAEEIARNILI
jgi:broad-specificity NMP kinase